MAKEHPNNFPKLHNAAWPGVVGKDDGGEPSIGLDTMLDMTVAAEVDGVKFDGVDLSLCPPHVNFDSTDEELEALADKVRSRNLVIGSVSAPVWLAAAALPFSDFPSFNRTMGLPALAAASAISSNFRRSLNDST